MDDVLDRDTLTMATAQRQWLAAGRPATVAGALHHLVGIQAQEPFEPYVGLWSRLTAFTSDDLAALLESREAVRTQLMRRTLHLVTAADARPLRELHAVMLRSKASHVLRQVKLADGTRAQVDLDELAAAAGGCFDGEPLILAEVGRRISATFPGVPTRALGDVFSSLVPLVQVPPRGLWGRKGAAACTTYDRWWAADPSADIEPAETDLVLRYLAAYGPASTADVRAWSGVSGLPAAVAALGGRLRRHRDERGRTLLDLADREVLDPTGTQAVAELPVRFVPAFDNVVLGYDDRSRVIDDEHRGLSVMGARYVLVRGRVAATWTSPGFGGFAGGRATVEVTPVRSFTRAERAEVLAEGHRLADFLGEGSGRVVLS